MWLPAEVKVEPSLRSHRCTCRWLKVAFQGEPPKVVFGPLLTDVLCPYWLSWEFYN